MNNKEVKPYDWKKINRECFERDRLAKATQDRTKEILNNKNNQKKVFPRTKPF